MSAAQVTEAHKQLVATIVEQAFRFAEGNHKITPLSQIIADSEAKATAQANAQVESLISSAKNAIPASEHPAEPTVENWAWQIRNLGDDRRLVYAERDQLRAEVERLKKLSPVSAFEMNPDDPATGDVHYMAQSNARLLQHATDKLVDCAKRAERAEAELATAKAIIASIEEDGTEEHNAAVRLRRELATERARLDWLEGNAGDIPRYHSRSWIWIAHQNLREKIDAAMKEGA